MYNVQIIMIIAVLVSCPHVTFDKPLFYYQQYNSNTSVTLQLMFQRYENYENVKTGKKVDWDGHLCQAAAAF